MANENEEGDEMTDEQIICLAEECAIIRRLTAEPRVMLAVSRMEAELDPEIDRIEQEARRAAVAAMVAA